jgi:arylsulfatase A-like enzyme
MLSPAIPSPEPVKGSKGHNAGLVPLLALAVSFAIVTGLVEAFGLTLFQRINWASWGQIEHVSPPIYWVAPIWDCALFLLAAGVLAIIGRFVPRLPMIRAAIFIFATLMFYDWLALPERLVHRSALILALGLATVLFRGLRKHELSLIRLSRAMALGLSLVVVLAWAGISIASWVSERSATSRLPAAQPDAPNVVVIVVDTLRADHLSSYGYFRPTSPNLDRIAQQGVLFENAIAPSSWTLPSHASLLTGRYAYEHGATDVKSPPESTLDDRYPTLPEVFAQHGYRTGAFSANYIYFCKDLGLGRGFLHFEDYFSSFFDGSIRTLYGREITRLILSRNVVRRVLIRLGFPSIDELQPNSKTSWMVRKRASEVNREALTWIDHDRTRPFFVFMNYFDTHRPYGTPPGYPRKFLSLNTHAAYLDEVTPAPVPHSKTDLYDESIGYGDDQIGKFFDELKRRGLDQRTLVVISSDHGDLLGEHGLMGHRNTLYMPLIHVPLVLWQPGNIPAGVRVAVPVSNVSLAATLTELLGMREAEKYPGPSLKKLWSEPHLTPQWPHPFSELAQFKREGIKVPSRYGAMTSLITPQYHYMWHQTQGTQLYAWGKDPGETSDLIGTPVGESIAPGLAQEIQTRTAYPR